MKLSILVVNYNTEEHIAQLLEDISQQSLAISDYQVVVVNNIQNNKLNDILDKYYQYINLEIVPSKKNVGFGRGMNLAADHAQGEHVLMMNPDVCIENKDFLKNLLEYSNKTPNYGVISCKILNQNNEDTSEFYSYEFGDTMGYDGQICWFHGSLLLLRAEIYQQLGGYDPDFFMYCEDVDLCYRVKKMGLDLIKVNELSVFHLGWSSVPKKNYDLYYRWYCSKFVFAHKHFSTKKFAQLLDGLELKAKKRLKSYKLLSIFPINHEKTQRKIFYWTVMADVIKTIRQNGIESLYYKG